MPSFRTFLSEPRTHEFSCKTLGQTSITGEKLGSFGPPRPPESLAASFSGPLILAWGVGLQSPALPYIQSALSWISLASWSALELTSEAFSSLRYTIRSWYVNSQFPPLHVPESGILRQRHEDSSLLRSEPVRQGATWGIHVGGGPELKGRRSSLECTWIFVNALKVHLFERALSCAVGSRSILVALSGATFSQGLAWPAPSPSLGLCSVVTLNLTPALLLLLSCISPRHLRHVF